VKRSKTSKTMDKVIVSAMFILSVVIAFSIREDMHLQVSLVALVVIGLKATKKVLDD
jgi:Na+/H+ antiporter NhaD/arsenite permease-like protein